MIEGVTIRTRIVPGDIGRITALHGLLYATEYGYDHTFEAYVGEHLSVFARGYHDNSESRERIWIAERGSALVGCIAIVQESPTTARVRWFIVTPEARGGLGRRLLRESLMFSRACGYERVMLSTVKGLDAAARLYRDEGFVLTNETGSKGWGIPVIDQLYELEL